MSRRARPIQVAALAAAVLSAGAASAATAPQTRPVAKAISASGFGRVLATTSGQALYIWNREADRKVHCTGACVAAWPILYVPKGTTVPKRIAGFAGTFGTIRRPENGRLQVTWNGRPLYTYAHEARREVRCNNVDGWFAVRASGKIF